MRIVVQQCSTLLITRTTAGGETLRRAGISWTDGETLRRGALPAHGRTERHCAEVLFPAQEKGGHCAEVLFPAQEGGGDTAQRCSFPLLEEGGGLCAEVLFPAPRRRKETMRRGALSRSSRRREETMRRGASPAFIDGRRRLCAEVLSLPCYLPIYHPVHTQGNPPYIPPCTHQGSLPACRPHLCAERSLLSGRGTPPAQRASFLAGEAPLCAESSPPHSLPGIPSSLLACPVYRPSFPACRPGMPSRCPSMLPSVHTIPGVPEMVHMYTVRVASMYGFPASPTGRGTSAHSMTFLSERQL